MTLVYGTETNNIPLIDWFGIIVEKQGDNLVLNGILEAGETKVGETLPNDGFILFVNENDSISYPLIMNNIEAGNKVTVGFNYKSVSGIKPDGTSYGNIMINLASEQEENEEDNSGEGNSGNNPEEVLEDSTNGLKPIKNDISTKDFININLYDYGYDNASSTHINTKYLNNGKYPKFQGSTATNTFSKNSIYGYGGFDGNIVTDMDAILAQVNSGISYNAAGTINETYGGDATEAGTRPNSNLAYGGANVPLSTKNGYNAMNRKANSNNYPQLSDGTSLGYLFGETAVPYVQKKNSEGIDGLFQYDSEHDRYYYDSTTTHAQYNGKNKFDLYDKVITPNFMVYPFGNFMPFNDIQQAKKVSTIKDSSYFSSVATSASNNSNSPNDDYGKLASFLKGFVTNAGSKTAKNYIKMYADIHRTKYFDKDGNSNRAQDNADFDQMLSGVYSNLSNMYNIDYDDAKDFFFGMSMEFNFVQPTGGVNQFGDYVEPVTFDFSGDDDVWVYIDDTLVLDLTGIHRVLGGQIDFSNGTVKYYAYNFATLDVYTTPYTTVSFAELFDDSVLTAPDSNGNRTLKNGTNHNLKFYFMERGAGSSVCKISFNLQESYINGQKHWVGDTEADRPEKIKVNLYQNDVLYTSTTTTAADDWKFTFINIPFYDTDGNRYLYRIEEALDDPKIRCYEPEYYTNPSNIHEKSITNTFKYRDVDVSKIWDDNNNEANLRPPGGIQVELTATVNGQPYTIPDTVEKIVTLDDSNDWKYEWQRIDRFDADGNDIVYSVDEINLPSAYCNKIEEEEGKEYSFIITNTIARSITITKCDERDSNRKLGNAQFKLEKLIEEDGEWIVDTSFEPRIANTSTESGSLGVLVYDDLFYGKYRLTEIKAPAGYKISSDPIEIDVTTDQLNFNVTVTNKKGGLLPFTGGNGIIVMEAMGATMLVLSISKYKRRRRVVEAARRIRFSNGRIEFKKYKK